MSMEFMRNPTQIRLYDIFRKDLHMPDDRAQNLVSTINEALKDHSSQDREDLATNSFVREEILATKAFVRDEILATRAFVRDEILATRVFVKDEISAATQLLKDQIRDLEVKMTRSIYLVNLIQFLAIVASIITIFAFLRK